LSVYSELLRLALADDTSPGRSVSELVTRAVTSRGAAHAGYGPTATRIADALAYDVALVRLCERLGVPHGLTGEAAAPDARRRAELLVLEQMPALDGVLARRTERGENRGGPR
jgi:hypothetical protein